MARTDKGLEIGQVAPDWEIKRGDGQAVKAILFRGRPLVIFFFRGTWCPSCRKQMEDIKEQWKALSSRAQIIGIIAEPVSKLEEYMRRANLPFTLLADPDRKVIVKHNVYRRFGLDGFRVAFPSTLILDNSGVVRYCYVGESTFDRPEISEVIYELDKLTGKV
jgi:peroxiredoxin Q/BCP